MSEKILVTYASRLGSTAGVAQAIAQELSGNGAIVDVIPVQEVSSLSPYRAVVIGSAIQGSQWLPEAMKFVRTHQDALTRLPCAIFTVCMTLAIDGGKYRQGVADWVEPVRMLVHPVSQEIFAGVLDISKVPALGDRLKFRLSVKMGVWAEGDHRDWNAIHAWAASLSSCLS